jgi:hypothetical protein
MLTFGRDGAIIREIVIASDGSANVLAHLVKIERRLIESIKPNKKGREQ